MDGQNQQVFGNANQNPPETDAQNPQSAKVLTGKPKAPILVRILAILMMLGGAASMAYLIYFSIVAATQSLNYPWLIRITLFIVAASLMAAAWGLRDMKKWGLYLVSTWLAFSILSTLYSAFVQQSETRLVGLCSILINGIILFYLVYIRNKFEPEKPHRPAVLAMIVAIGLLVPAISLVAFLSFKKTQEKDLPITANVLDHTASADVVIVGTELDNYGIEHNDSFTGFSIENSDAKDFAKDYADEIRQAGCKSSLKIDISPDGQKFVVHRPLCSDPAKSACYENNFTEAVTVDTATVEKNYSCKP